MMLTAVRIPAWWQSVRFRAASSRLCPLRVRSMIRCDPDSTPKISIAKPAARIFWKRAADIASRTSTWPEQRMESPASISSSQRRSSCSRSALSSMSQAAKLRICSCSTWWRSSSTICSAGRARKAPQW